MDKQEERTRDQVISLDEVAAKAGFISPQGQPLGVRPYRCL